MVFVGWHPAWALTLNRYQYGLMRKIIVLAGDGLSHYKKAETIDENATMTKRRR